MSQSSPESRRSGSDAVAGLRKNLRSLADRERGSRGSTVLPPTLQMRLNNLFRDVEKEFEVLYLENLKLRERISVLERGPYEADEKDKTVIDEHDAFESMLKAFAKSKAFKTRSKFKVHTSKIVSTFKTPSLSCSFANEFKGHRDGIWDIGVARNGQPIIGTASADKTARIWSLASGNCISVYTGHAGSVNAIAFHPTQDLVLTASGDGMGHVWKSSPIHHEALPTVSSEDSPESSDEEQTVPPGGRLQRQSSANCHVVRTPVSTLAGHQGVVVSCQWLNEDLAVTAGWDRVANLYNVETGSLLQSLAGHDSDLTYVSCHSTQRLVTTCSTDSTFRLWDFRDAIHSVSVFQGHTDSVTCAVFSKSDQVVSGSDDRSVKVWDLRNMRAPTTSIQMQSAVNRLDVSSSGLIAIPLDNRQVVIHDLNGQKLLRLPRNSARSHHRMVSSVCWSAVEDTSNVKAKANLFSAGFDRLAFGWLVKASSGKEDANKNKRDPTSSSVAHPNATFGIM